MWLCLRNSVQDFVWRTAISAGDDEESNQEPVKQLQLTSHQDHSFKAKLFYKKADEYVELGVGNLKVVNSDGQTVQLLMRNDTSIGNVMLNVRLTPEIPMMLNKNNVIVVCPPNPPIGKSEDKESLTYLIRVKTAQQAEQLYSTIKDTLKWLGNVCQYKQLDKNRCSNLRLTNLRSMSYIILYSRVCPALNHTALTQHYSVQS